MTIESFTVERATGDLVFQQVTEDHSAVGTTEAIRVIGEIALQISGDATAITAVLERSTRDPGLGANWAPAGDAISGNPSTGLQVKRYAEPTRAWYRVNISSITGGSVVIVFSGEKA